MKLKFIIFVLLLACFINAEPSLDGKLVLQYGKFCKFIKVNENNYKLEWGKNGIRNNSIAVFDTFQIWKCYLDTETNEFTVLRNLEGSDTWSLIILPLNKSSEEIIYENALGFDLGNKTVVIEEPSKDTILLVENFISKKRMAIGKEFVRCQSGFPHYCIDSLVFLNNHLKFQWITPHKFDKNKKIELKEYRINLR